MKLFTRNREELKTAELKKLPPTVVAKNMFITGEMICLGDVKIDGFFKGNLIAEGKVIVGEEGQVQGTLKSSTLLVQGIVEGTMECTGLLNLKSPAVVIGETFYGDIQIDSGTKIKGKINQLNSEQIKLLQQENNSAIKRLSEKLNSLKEIKVVNSSDSADQVVVKEQQVSVKKQDETPKVSQQASGAISSW